MDEQIKSLRDFARHQKWV